MTSTPMVTGLSRVFIIEGRARGDHTPEYMSCVRAGAIGQGFGDVEKIECPSDERYNEFVEAAQVQGSVERAKTTIVGRYARDVVSRMLELARRRCPLDVQFHIGVCTDPRVFNKFEKIVIWEGATLTNYSTDEIGALGSGDNKSIDETGDLSAKSVYEVVPIVFSERASSIITNEVLDVMVADILSCGECEGESSGCEKIYALTKAAGGSPGTPADIVVSLDGGVTWFAKDIDTLGIAEDPNAFAFVSGTYIVVVSRTSNSLHYALKSEFTLTVNPTWTEVGTGFVVGGGPRAICKAGSGAFIVGDGGYVYWTDDPTAGVTVLDAGQATADQLNAVSALSDTFAVAVGNNGAVVVTQNGTIWTKVTGPVGVGVDLTCVAVKSETEWWVGTSNGYLYATYDAGLTWTHQAFSGGDTGVVKDIVFATDSVVYLAHQTAATKGRILRSFDGGHSWVVEPESGAWTANDRINALAACIFNPNMVVGGGLADNGTDGFLTIGKGV